MLRGTYTDQGKGRGVERETVWVQKNEHVQKPEVGMSMVCLRNGRKALEVGAQRVVDEEGEGNPG